MMSANFTDTARRRRLRGALMLLLAVIVPTVLAEGAPGSYGVKVYRVDSTLYCRLVGS